MHETWIKHGPSFGNAWIVLTQACIKLSTKATYPARLRVVRCPIHINLQSLVAAKLQPESHKKPHTFLLARTEIRWEGLKPKRTNRKKKRNSDVGSWKDRDLLGSEVHRNTQMLNDHCQEALDAFFFGRPFFWWKVGCLESPQKSEDVEIWIAQGPFYLDQVELQVNAGGWLHPGDGHIPNRIHMVHGMDRYNHTYYVPELHTGIHDTYIIPVVCSICTDMRLIRHLHVQKNHCNQSSRCRHLRTNPKKQNKT